MLRFDAFKELEAGLVPRDNTCSPKRCNQAEDRSKPGRVLTRSDIRLLLRIHNPIIVHTIKACSIPNNELRCGGGQQRRILRISIEIIAFVEGGIELLLFQAITE